MFTFQFCPKLQDKHCKSTKTKTMTGKIRYMPPPYVSAQCLNTQSQHSISDLNLLKLNVMCLLHTYIEKRSVEYTCGHFQNSTNVFCRCKMAKSGRNGTQCSTHSINNEQIGISGRRESKSFCQRKNDDAIGKLVFPPLPPPPMSLPKQITSRISVEGWAFNQIYKF